MSTGSTARSYEVIQQVPLTPETLTRY